MSPVSSDCPPLPTEQTELVLPFFHTPDPTQSLCPYTGGVHRLCRSRSIPQYSSSFLLHPFVLFPKGIFFVFLWTRVRRLESLSLKKNLCETNKMTRYIQRYPNLPFIVFLGGNPLPGPSGFRGFVSFLSQYLGSLG